MFKKITQKFTIHTVLILTSLLSIFPFIWLTSTSLKGLSEDEKEALKKQMLDEILKGKK